MTFDPFADGDTPEDPQDGPWDDGTANQTTVTATAVTPTGEHKVRVTLKAGPGDAPWITIDGADVNDAANQLGDTDGVRRLVELTVSAARFLHRSYGPSQQRGTSTSSGSGSGQRQPGKPEGATEAPNGEKRYCEHGQRVYKSGFSEKTGKNWGAFDCPEKVCDREWANNRR